MTTDDKEPIHKRRSRSGRRGLVQCWQRILQIRTSALFEAKNVGCFKGELGELEFYFRKMTFSNKNLWWSLFFLIRLGCREIWKMDQTEVTKHFSPKQRCTLGVSVSVARWQELGLGLNQDALLKKKTKKTVKQWDLWWS